MTTGGRKRWWPALAIALLLGGGRIAWARPQTMHIMEGFLPPAWALFWFAVALPFWLLGFRKVRHLVQQQPETRLLLGLTGAFAFLLSALKLPSITGSSSHPTGTGLGAVLFGPPVMSVLGTLVLLFQSLFLAHGGLTTLGANSVSMAIAGPLVACGVWRLLRHRHGGWAIFLAATLASLVTYLVTALQLGLAYPDPAGGMLGAVAKFAALFALTQIPLALAEGLFTLIVFNSLASGATAELALLGLGPTPGAE